MHSIWYKEYLIDPFSSGINLDIIENDFLRSSENDLVRHPIYNGKTPLVVDSSIFDIPSILQKVPTTQNPSHSDTKNLKNYLRRKILPTLTDDYSLLKRYKNLRSNLNCKEPRILVIGAGEKSEFYKEIFGKWTITSDIHLQYGVDIVLDAHYIPFRDGTFDLVLAAQVLEHVLNPSKVAKEIQRVLKKDGIAQIEVPFVFPYHSAPYDFFRFTYSGIRSLFRMCKIINMEVSEGLFSATAVSFSTALIELSGTPKVRSILLMFSRYMFFWLKYLDRLSSKKLKNKMSLPKGYAVTFMKDGFERTDTLLMQELNDELRNTA